MPTLELSAKSSDQCLITLYRPDGPTIQKEGYFCGSDYLELVIDWDTGQIWDWDLIKEALKEDLESDE